MAVRTRGAVRRRGFVVLTALLSVAAGIGVVASTATASASPAAQPAAPQATTNVQAFMTLYGYADNSPPGTDIAHPCIHSQAGGTGTYADPITFATDVAELGWCTIIYVPYMERYFIHEDECSQCDQTWNSAHLYRFDMWAGGDASSLVQPGRKALLGCESTWTRGNSPTDPSNPTIEIDPPSNLPVVTASIFTPPTSCWTPISVANPGGQTSFTGGSGVSLQVRASDTSPGQTLTYSATGLPAGLSINGATGLISGTPVARGRSRVTVTASDTYNSADARFIWKVKPLRRRR
jgi:Putative Ig domain